MDYVPSEFDFEPRSPTYGPFFVLGLFDTNSAHSSRFLAIFGPFLGYIVELEGKKGLLCTGQLRHTWGVASWPFGVGLGAVFGQKKLLWGRKCAFLGGHLPTWRPRPGAPPVRFWLKTWIWQGHHLGSRNARVQ